jgi:hypothetical protein
MVDGLSPLTWLRTWRLRRNALNLGARSLAVLARFTNDTPDITLGR